MAARQVAATATIEQLRTTFNTLSATDFGDISQLSSSISASNLVAAMNELESEVTPFTAAFVASQTDLGGAPATADSLVIRDADAGAVKEMTIANLFTTPDIAEINTSGDFTLDAGGGDILLKDDGATFGGFTNTSGNLIIKSGTTTAMTFSGANVTVAGNLTVSGTTTTVDSSTINVTNSFTFEGSTADSFETTLTVEDPTADRTVTIPNATGQIVLRDTTDTLTNKSIDLDANTLTGTFAEFNSALQSESFVGLAASQTLTNKTLTSPTLTTPSMTTPTITSGGLVFEGSTADSFETTLTVTDPTADRTITIPNNTGTLALTSDITGGGSAGSFTTLTSSGNTTIGNATSDTVTFNARVNSDFVPSADDTHSLGTASLKWSALHVSGSTIFLGNAELQASGTVVVLPQDSKIGARKIPEADINTGVVTRRVPLFTQAGGLSSAAKTFTMKAGGRSDRVFNDFTKEGNVSITAQERALFSF